MNGLHPPRDVAPSVAPSDAGLAAIPDAVRWYQGMRLAPQHFQLQAARQEMLAPALLRAVEPLHWGLLRLAVRQDGRCVIVDAIEAIMPDGLPVAAGPEARLRIELKDTPDDADKTWRVSLAVPGRALAGSRRYLPDGQGEIPDQNGEAGPLQVSRLKPNLMLVGGSGEGYAPGELLPLLRFRDIGGLPSRMAYIAPWLRVGPQLGLYRRIEALCARLRASYATLSDAFDSEQAGAGAEPGIDDLRRLALLPALGARVLELEAAYAGGQAHPRQLHALLAGLLGVLAAGMPQPVLPRLPAFDYRDIGASMMPLLAQLETARRLLAPQLHRVLFRPREDGVLAATLPPGAATPLVLALRKPAATSDAAMRHWLLEAAIASANRLDEALHRRSPGMAVRLLEGREALRMGGDSGHAVFQLKPESDGGVWYTQGEALCIRSPGGSAEGYAEPLQVELLLRRAGGPGETRGAR
ncbi:type VI secretion system baseplate subunit TssK [Massilia sp. YIM B02769]|uniref:type VI secretion system baseplate subunit TssK n=1 Tax=unclassified Massilia TaxID=2609279 RepID=UPI0025B62ADA|nr:type VI secretion system baseplate subunit TssK [Massilia sp.]MDN4059140.1 type VI secretion system baseplate subunit TssK [Massilia sp. YIM B02769]